MPTAAGPMWHFTAKRFASRVLSSQASQPSHRMPPRNRKRHRPPKEPIVSSDSPDSLSDFLIVDLWRASRLTSQPDPLVPLPPGTPRTLSFQNAKIAARIVVHSLPEILPLCWGPQSRDLVHLLAINIIKGLLPASRSYSQALLLDEASQHARR